MYRLNHNFVIDVGFIVTCHNVLTAVTATNDFLFSLPESLFKSIDFKTTGAMIGALLCSHLVHSIGTPAIVNPIEKGHPDIIPVAGLGASEEMLRNYPQGLEIKGTIGNVSTNIDLRAGVRRIENLSGITWQAHHQEVNHLMGFVWDFTGERGTFGFPIISGIFYSDKLTEEDWGKISGTKGRNTKVSGMTKSGKIKMGRSWAVILDDAQYINKFQRFLATSISSE